MSLGSQIHKITSHTRIYDSQTSLENWTQKIFFLFFLKQKLRDYWEFYFFSLILQNVCRTAEWFDRLWYWGYLYFGL